jgi:hypothetical protein
MESGTVFDHESPTRSEDAQMTAIYTQLLEAVLAYEADSEDGPRSQGPLADVIRLRHILDRHATRTDPGWALQAVADQLAYDAALVRLSRKRGIVGGLEAFDIPEQGRASLEGALIARGVDLPARTGQVATPEPD